MNVYPGVVQGDCQIWSCTSWLLGLELYKVVVRPGVVQGGC